MGWHFNSPILVCFGWMPWEKKQFDSAGKLHAISHREFDEM